MPDLLSGVRQVVLLVIDGLGWDQLVAHRDALPTLTRMAGGPITTVVPSTTATALTSLAVGVPPGEHGIVGYRMHVGAGTTLNVLRWRTSDGDARAAVPPGDVQPRAAFGGTSPLVVTRAEFAGTGFSLAHLRGARLVGWHMPSTIALEVRRALDTGDAFVYAYYDGVDKVAHAHGLDEHYVAELAAADRLVADVASALPAGAVLVVTADHGQVDVRDNTLTLDADVVGASALVTGEARFRWLHAGDGGNDRLEALARERYEDTAVVRTREEIERAGWLGPALSAAARSRLGDLAIVATGSTAYLDPTDPGEPRLGSRHGGLSAAEMRIPLLALGG